MRSRLLSKYSASSLDRLRQLGAVYEFTSLRSALTSFSILPFSNQDSLRMIQRLCAASLPGNSRRAKFQRCSRAW